MSWHFAYAHQRYDRQAQRKLRHIAEDGSEFTLCDVIAGRRIAHTTPIEQILDIDPCDDCTRALLRTLRTPVRA